MASYTGDLNQHWQRGRMAEKEVWFDSKGPPPEPAHAAAGKSAGSVSQGTGCCCRPLTHAQQQATHSASHRAGRSQCLKWMATMLHILKYIAFNSFAMKTSLVKAQNAVSLIAATVLIAVCLSLTPGSYMKADPLQVHGRYLDSPTKWHAKVSKMAQPPQWPPTTSVIPLLCSTL